MKYCSREIHLQERFVLSFYRSTNSRGITTWQVYRPSESGRNTLVLRGPYLTVWTLVEDLQVSSLGERDTMSGSMDCPLQLSTTLPGQV